MVCEFTMNEQTRLGEKKKGDDVDQRCLVFDPKAEALAPRLLPRTAFPTSEATTNHNYSSAN